ncbi:TPA: hypothetical protein ACMDP0_004736 [Vibrio parahaemolyticus]|nr:hypothetical protein [Vibrio parahaemolyticus]
MSKYIVITAWFFSMGSLLWLLSKSEPSSLLMDWFHYMFTLFSGIFGGNALIKMINTPRQSQYWEALRKLIVPFYVGIIALIAGVFFAAQNVGGSEWVGVILSFVGISFYYYILARVDHFYKMLTIR